MEISKSYAIRFDIFDHWIMNHWSKFHVFIFIIAHDNYLEDENIECEHYNLENIRNIKICKDCHMYISKVS